jgi:hypothetical protein
MKQAPIGGGQVDQFGRLNSTWFFLATACKSTGSEPLLADLADREAQPGDVDNLPAPPAAETRAVAVAVAGAVAVGVAAGWLL